MKMIYFLVMTAAFLAAAPTDTRGAQPDQEEVLSNLFSGILATRNDEERIRLNDSILLIIDQYVRSGSVFSHRFENLRYLGQILSSDGNVKIITWNIILTDGTSKYYCYIIRKGTKNEGNSITRLEGRNMDEAPRTDLTYSEDNWYGALYYGIQPFKTGREVFYAVLGLDYANLQVSRKIIDVLSFTGDGRVVFGKECFKKDDEIKMRDVFDYQADGVMSLRFGDKKTIIFDNLAPITEGHRYDQGFYGTEFSFNAYILKKGLWNFVTNHEVKTRQ